MQIKELENFLTEVYKNSPIERVGFITKDHKVIEVVNISNEPEYSFEVDPQDIIKYTEVVPCIATWHTHPKSDCNLSGEDFRMFQSWPKLMHIIIGSNGISVYSIKQNSMLKVGLDDLYK